MILPRWNNERTEDISELLVEEGDADFDEEMEYEWEMKINLDQPDYSELNASASADFEFEDEGFQGFELELDNAFQSEADILVYVREISPVATIPLNTAMRTECTAHTLQLVIKDGLKCSFMLFVFSFSKNFLAFA